MTSATRSRRPPALDAVGEVALRRVVVPMRIHVALAAPARAQRHRRRLGAVLAHPAARLGVTATAVGQIVMVAVMAMTPVHVRGAGYDAAHTLRLVGVLLSLHVAGMYAFSPVMGWLTDRLGHRRVILGGVVLLLAACAVAGTAGHDAVRLALGLLLLGLGWSATMIAGSALLSASMTAGKSVLCAPLMIERPTASTSSWMAAAAIMSGVWWSPV